MAKKFSQAHRAKIKASCEDSWKDPSMRVEQKKRIEVKRLLKRIANDIIESSDPLNIKIASQALINEIKKLDEQGRRRPFREILNILEKAILIRVLSHVNGNQKKAAKFLGLKYTTLYEKIKKYNIKFLKKIVVIKIEKKNAQDK